MFDPALLRTFLAVAETKNFTRAAAQLGLSQPTVSQQIRRLEEAAGRWLVVRDTRAVRLTDNGDAMAGFARTILAAHASAESYFTGSAMSGRLRFGAADDLAMTQLPRILRHFRQGHPQLNLELTVNQSGPLYRRLKAGALDLIFIKMHPGQNEGKLVRTDSMVWVGLEKTTIEPGQPVPLIAYQDPSLSRQLAIDALEAAGRTWRITCSTREVNGVLAAVRAGLGVAVFPRSLIPSDLVMLSNRLELPTLGGVDFTLLANPLAAAGPVEALSSAIMDRSLA
ncbi:LysR family transcriptional regulator [Plantibacter sp. VKM Ac-2885]|uniref:LysR substrate-binding domain-containing protein n=1 Tax=Plantibacter TaxID=190323 RepID=UPI00099BDF86|nr:MULTISPECIES: LysR substrate-binding domain-containing protein [Plantibacter]AQX82217.1 LysR family transcriptional regulator [Plantibacter flavus]MBF4514459.1 LysR family transcriptional regulator [Plantibacter sp. VKM Ac-2885]NUJ89379.1 LysR family transcriptional regulator [Plantibacter sp. MCCC 1A11337]